MSKLFFAALCDDVREEKAGKFSLMGLFDRFIVGDFRVVLPTFWFFAQIGFDAEGDHALVIEFRSVSSSAAGGTRNFHSLRFFPEGGGGRLYTGLRWNID